MNILYLVIGIVVPADAALAAVLVELDAKTAAEDLVVVVVDRVGVAEPPHGVARRRVHHAAVAMDGVQKALKYSVHRLL